MSKKKAPEAQKVISEEEKMINNVRRKVPYMQMHRVGRIFNHLSQVKVKNGYDKTELIIKSSMINGFVNNTYMDKLVMEAATLSFIPQYCKVGDSGYSKKLISQNFGQDVKNLVNETHELNIDMQKLLNDELEDEYAIHKYSHMCKEIYLFQVYVDLVINFSVRKKVLVQDGIKCEAMFDKRVYQDLNGVLYLKSNFEKVVKRERMGKPILVGITHEGDEYTVVKTKSDIIKDTDGEWVPKPDFDQYQIEIIEWKMDMLKYNGVAIKEAILSAVNNYKRCKGFAFQMKHDSSHLNARDAEKGEPYYGMPVSGV